MEFRFHCDKNYAKAKAVMIYMKYYYSHINYIPGIGAHHCNYAALLAGRLRIIIIIFMYSYLP